MNWNSHRTFDHVPIVTRTKTTDLHDAIRKNDLSKVQNLARFQNVSVESTTIKGWTALHQAVHHGHLNMVKYLVETCHSNIYATAHSSGSTALHFACRAASNLALVQYLVQKGGKKLIQAVDLNQQTALDIVQKIRSSFGHAARLEIAAYLKQQQEQLKEAETIAVPTTALGLGTSNETLERDREQMKCAILKVAQHQETFAVSEAYVRSILHESTELGRGFFGTVHRGHDRTLNWSFAVKMINADILMGGTTEEIQRTKKTFEREQQTLSHFHHPNIVRLYAFSFPTEIRGNYYLLYELAEKGSLDTFWNASSNGDANFAVNSLKRLRLSFRRRVQIALDVMTALRFLHVGNTSNERYPIASCFHRDVKSANIVLKQDLTAQLIDCGLAKFVVETPIDDKSSSPSSSLGGPKGTPGYICPMYGDGEIAFDCACDIYAFGVVLVELWTGTLQNHVRADVGKFNFTTQYMRVDKKGHTKRDLLADVDSTLGYDCNTTFPNYMVRFVELAKSCMDDHDDIPDGKDVMTELVAIHQACIAEEEGVELSVEPKLTLSDALPTSQFCERCQTCPALTDATLCRICCDAEHNRDECKRILTLLQSFGDRLDAMVPLVSNLDARCLNMIPRLFYIVPAEPKRAMWHPREYLKSQIATKYYLYFVCAHSKRIVDAAPIKMRLTKDWVKAAAPALAVSLQVLQCGLSVFAGISLCVEGLAIEVTSVAVEQMLIEVTSLMNDNNKECSSNADWSAHDVPELRGDAYNIVVEKATEQNAWRYYMEPVCTTSNPAVVWVTKEIANDPSHGYILIAP